MMHGAIIENGVVTNVILLPDDFTGDEWAGQQVVISETAKIGDSYIDGVFTTPAPLISLAQLRAAKAADIDQACRDSIYAGFTSEALGAVYHYPAKDKDQQNLVGSVTESLYPNLPPEWVTPFWCATGSAAGDWAYRLHTAAQIQQVGLDAKGAIIAALTKNAQLQAQIAGADEEALALISWDDEEEEAQP
jgi:hypothetical protein